MAARKKPTGSSQEERDRIALGKLESFIDGTMDSQMVCSSCRKEFSVKEIPSSVVALWRARYDKLRPSLASTEVTVTDPRDKLKGADLGQQLVALFVEKPHMWEQIQELMRGAHATNAAHNGIQGPSSSDPHSVVH